MMMRRKTGKTSKAPASEKEPLTDRADARKQEIFEIFMSGQYRQLVELMQQTKEYITILADLVSDDRWLIRRCAIRGLQHAADNGIDISEAVRALGKALYDEDTEVQWDAIRDLKIAAEKGMDISDCFNEIENALSDEKPQVREKIGMLWKIAAEKGMDISEHIPALAKALHDKDADVRWVISDVLTTAAWKGADVSVAIEALTNAISDVRWEVRENVVEALDNAAEKGDHQTREKIVSELMRFIKSEEFIREAQRNTPKYIDMVEKLGRLINRIYELEREAA